MIREKSESFSEKKEEKVKKVGFDESLSSSRASFKKKSDYIFLNWCLLIALFSLFFLPILALSLAWNHYKVERAEMDSQASLTAVQRDVGEGFSSLPSED